MCPRRVRSKPRWSAWQAKTIQPEQFADLDLNQELSGFYQQLYGLDEATITAEILPRLTGDIAQ